MIDPQLSTPTTKPSITERMTTTNGVDRKGPEELARLGISAPFPKSQRRARRAFTVEEDEALLRGFTTYGAQWTKIRSDPDLGLTSRSRTDLRDRFRNRYPDKFVEAGHKFQHKRSEDTNKETEATITSNETGEDPAQTPSRSDDINAHMLNSAAPPQTSKDGGKSHHSLKLLTTSYTTDAYFGDFADLTPSEEDDPSTITLSRNIFDWADQQSNHHSHNKTTMTLQNKVPASRHSASGPSKKDRTAEDSNTGMPSKTLSRLDQFNINPMLALKVPHSSGGLQSGILTSGTTASMSLSLPNLYPPLPLSGILNGPLPPPAELVGGGNGGFDGEADN
jgi:hypothetical protein